MLGLNQIIGFSLCIGCFSSCVASDADVQVMLGGLHEAERQFVESCVMDRDGGAVGEHASIKELLEKGLYFQTEWKIEGRLSKEETRTVGKWEVSEVTLDNRIKFFSIRPINKNNEKKIIDWMERHYFIGIYSRGESSVSCINSGYAFTMKPIRPAKDPMDPVAAAIYTLEVP